MSVARDLVRFARHFYLLWHAGQLRFRLETFGVYYPALPYRSSWWQVSPRSLLLLIRQLPSYMHWVSNMEEVRRGTTPKAWRVEVKNEL